MPILWFLPAIVGLLLLIALLALRRYMVRVEAARIEITRHEVVSPDLPPDLDGFTICQVSDLHITARPRHEAAFAEAIRSVRADLFVLTGDMIFLQSGVRPFFRWLDSLGAAIRPAVAILGNAEHKSYVRRADVVEGFRERGIPLLSNETIRFPFRSTELQIVGVDDPHTRHSDFARAYAEAQPDLWTLLLCHSPDGVKDLDGHRADLMLCGHTHGGQVCLPVIGPLSTNTRRVKGLISGWYSGEALAKQARHPIGDTRLYISRGLGGGSFEGRLLCRPEIAVFTLRKSTVNE